MDTCKHCEDEGCNCWDCPPDSGTCWACYEKIQNNKNSTSDELQPSVAVLTQPSVATQDRPSVAAPDQENEAGLEKEEEGGGDVGRNGCDSTSEESSEYNSDYSLCSMCWETRSYCWELRTRREQENSTSGTCKTPPGPSPNAEDGDATPDQRDGSGVEKEAEEEPALGETCCELTSEKSEEEVSDESFCVSCRERRSRRVANLAGHFCLSPERAIYDSGSSDVDAFSCCSETDGYRGGYEKRFADLELPFKGIDDFVLETRELVKSANKIVRRMFLEIEWESNAELALLADRRFASDYNCRVFFNARCKKVAKFLVHVMAHLAQERYTSLGGFVCRDTSILIVPRERRWPEREPQRQLSKIYGPRLYVLSV